MQSKHAVLQRCWWTIFSACMLRPVGLPLLKLTKDNDGWCTPAHPAPDMATIVAALHDAQFLSESALDFIKRCFFLHEVKHFMPELA